MKTITVHINGDELRGRRLPHDESWREAALRALQRRYGKHAAVWGWNIDSHNIDRHNRVTQCNYRGTVVGKPPRNDIRCYPVLGEARVYRPVQP